MLEIRISTNGGLCVPKTYWEKMQLLEDAYRSKFTINLGVPKYIGICDKGIK